ncbi:hypothetical protein LINPERPRIM_LOCUS11671 [Linum perenne]
MQKLTLTCGVRTLLCMVVSVSGSPTDGGNSARLKTEFGTCRRDLANSLKLRSLVHHHPL